MGLGCEQATVNEPEFIDTIYEVIKVKLELAQASEQSVMAEQKSKADKRDAERRECNIRLKKLKLSQTTLLEQFLEGKLSKDDYQSQKVKITTAIQEAADQLEVLETVSESPSEFVDSHKKFFGQDSLTREMVQGLIKEIRVTSADKIEIVWKFQTWYNELQGLVS